MSLEMILLGMLRRPAGGYDLRSEFEHNARHFWSAELSQIYPTLQQMQRKGWLKSKSIPSTKGPPRRVYERTTKGIAALRTWLTSGPQLGAERFAYIAQLIFLGELGDWQQTLLFLEQLRDKLAASANFLLSAAAGVSDPTSSAERVLDATEFHEWISLQLGIRSLQAKAAWCDDATKLVRKRLTTG